MGKVKVINNTLDQNLNGTNFNNTASETIFSFGAFSVTSNLEGKKYVDYTNELSSFVRPVTLETMGVTDTQSIIIYNYSTNAVLNLDKSNLNTFIRFGSAYEFLRVAVQNIILSYPASLFMSSQISRNGNATFFEYVYDVARNTCTFKIPTNCIINKFTLITDYGNVSKPNNVELKNLNLSYDKYVVWSTLFPENNSSTILGFTGSTSGRPYLTINAVGNPFSGITSASAPLDFHLKPNNFIFEEFRSLLNDYEKYIVSQRDGTNGFKFTLKDPTLLDDGNIVYSDTALLWTTDDKYNIDIDTPSYQRFLESLLTIGGKYDTIKTDLIARFLTPASLKIYDLTEEGKMTKLLRIYGREFDQMREFIDSLVYINRVTYDKVNNVPDQLVKNLSRTFGWNYFSLVNETELVNSFLTIDDSERNLNTDLMPAEIDIELWRRILMNTNYFWKSKGTREAIKSIFLLIGIPEPFINITEYVYTVDGKINPNSVALKSLTLSDYPSFSLPYDTDGYPKTPLESPDFYFQISGDTDSGQRYMDVFRQVGFNLLRTVDNKKSWTQTGATWRIDDTTPQYYQEDSKLVINTKEVDVALDTARGIEYDVWNYIKYTDFPANSSGFTMPFSFVNISLPYTGTQSQFTLPFQYDPNNVKGKLEVRYNGILLATRDTYDGVNIDTTSNASEIDYFIIGNVIYLNNFNVAVNQGNRRDVIQATFIYSGATLQPVSGITVEYVVLRITADLITGQPLIPLPSYPRGDLQLTINGIALTKGTPQFTADYILDPANSVGGTNNIIIQNPEVIAYLYHNPVVQVAYVQVVGSNDISARSEVLRVDSFNSSKIYFNLSANKYVYKLNYKANSANEIKFLVDGIALEPITDYDINVMNPFEVFLPTGIKYGTVISVYYLVGSVGYFNPIIPIDFGVGDISNLSFLEFIELIQRRMINARNRKTISDFKGGWYPALLKIYTEYLKRSGSETLPSNGYTFQNLYPFLSKYNAFFNRFIDQLLSATIILKQSGLLIRNTVFTKQKFTYKRGVNVSSNNVTTIPRTLLPYFGDDGTQFLIAYTPPAPPTTTTTTTLPPITTTTTTTTTTVAPSVQTLPASGIGTTSFDTSGVNIPAGVWENVQAHAIMYSSTTNGTGWLYAPAPPAVTPLTSSSFAVTVSGLNMNETYAYKAYILVGGLPYYGDRLTVTTTETFYALDFDNAVFTDSNNDRLTI